MEIWHLVGPYFVFVKQLMLGNACKLTVPAFATGDSMGNVILFDPNRSESISARTIFDPLCSIAPAADCKTFALGYVIAESTYELRTF